VQCTRMDLRTGKPGFIDENKDPACVRVDLCKAGYDRNLCKRSMPRLTKLAILSARMRQSGRMASDLPTEGEIVYFAGCYAAYRNPKIAKATVAS
jgi:Fe-S oxidoreductase